MQIRNLEEVIKHSRESATIIINSRLQQDGNRLCTVGEGTGGTSAICTHAAQLKTYTEQIVQRTKVFNYTLIACRFSRMAQANEIIICKSDESLDGAVLNIFAQVEEDRR